METTVYICSEMDWKSRLHNWWIRLRLKSALQHFGLLITLMAYTVLGGLVKRFIYLFLFFNFNLQTLIRICFSNFYLFFFFATLLLK